MSGGTDEATDVRALLAEALKERDALTARVQELEAALRLIADFRNLTSSQDLYEAAVKRTARAALAPQATEETT
jgi:precorrin-6B methylase 2